MRREVLRRSDDGHTKGPGHRNGDHVLLERLAEPDAGVESLRNDVRQSRIDENFDDDLGIGLREPGQDGRDHHSSGRAGCGNPDVSRGPLE